MVIPLRPLRLYALLILRQSLGLRHAREYFSIPRH